MGHGAKIVNGSARKPTINSRYEDLILGACRPIGMILEYL